VDWRTAAGTHAFGGTLRWNNAWNGSDRANWLFTGLSPGWYEVLVTFDWQNTHAKATNAPYTVYDGPTTIATVRVDQTQPPSGPIHEGHPWESLGVFSIIGDTLRVELTDNADGEVLADAVRIVRIENDVAVLSVEKTLAEDEVTARVSVTIQVPEP
jgi:hypothetical protein